MAPLLLKAFCAATLKSNGGEQFALVFDCSVDLQVLEVSSATFSSAPLLLSALGAATIRSFRRLADPLLLKAPAAATIKSVGAPLLFSATIFRYYSKLPCNFRIQPWGSKLGSKLWQISYMLLEFTGQMCSKHATLFETIGLRWLLKPSCQVKKVGI